MKEIKVSVNTWYVVEGTAGATVTNPSTNRVIATIEDGKQTSFYATTPYVLASDDSVSVYKSTFNSAPVKLRLLGLLGGGESASALPRGYLEAEFLETTNTKIQVPFSFDLSQDEVRVEMETSISHHSIQREGYFKDSNSLTIGQYYKKFSVTLRGGQGTESADLTVGAFYKVWCIFSGQGYSFGSGTTVWYSKVQNYTNNVPFYELFRSDTWQWRTKRKWWKAYKNKELQFDLIPALDLQGRPVFYNKVDKTEYGNSGTGVLIVGFTISQAVKLSTLPATGGTLTVSLPTGYESDAGVMTALETARANGWTLTVQTYEAETAAATFGMRRIWVRKTADANGMYVDTDGKRWHVDWCVEMYTPDNSTPDMHGYEMFRSVDAAVTYWELTPWVDPEAEKLLTEYNANE